MSQVNHSIHIDVHGIESSKMEKLFDHVIELLQAEAEEGVVGALVPLEEEDDGQEKTRPVQKS